MPRYYCSSTATSRQYAQQYWMYCWADDERQAIMGANTVWRLQDIDAACVFPVLAVIQPKENEDNEPDFRVKKDA